MKTALLILALMIQSAIVVSGQDVIILNNKEKIDGKVTEVQLDVVKYKKASNINGPVYSILKSEIFLVIYENGVQESFDEEASTKDVTVPPSAAIIKSTPSEDPVSNSKGDAEVVNQTKETDPPSTVLSEEKNLANPDMFVPTRKYKLSYDDKEKLKVNDKDIYNRYRSARRMKNFYGTVKGVTTGIFIISLVNDISNFDVNNTSSPAISPTTYIFAGVGLITSFLNKGPKKRIKRSYDDHNNDIKRKIDSFSTLKIQLSGDGVGLVFSF